MDLDESFGNWLAGFIDGEGCFIIDRNSSTKAQTYYCCKFVLGVRGDDRDVLDEIARRTGLGLVRDHARKTRTDRPGTKPAVCWVIQNRTDCKGLVDLLERYPLRAKKRRDFEIWKLAVTDWLAHPRNARRNVGRDWGRMAELKTQLQEGRRFDAPPLLMVPELTVPLSTALF